jgi:glycosyltransferase involved in cell wall biosynthesis
VFVLTSREDPFPLACLEAAVLGKPVLCFDAGGMSEFLEPDERLVMPYLDVEAMSARLMELLGSESERLALGDALARRVRERHTIDATAPRLLELIREATSNV